MTTLVKPQEMSGFDMLDHNGGIVEIWRPVVGYVGVYQVSDQGRVRRVKPAPGTRFGRVLTPSADKDGYLRVTLCNAGKEKTLKVHRLVARAFIGEPPTGSRDVNHDDGVKVHNYVGNLEYTTIQANIDHAIRTGLRDLQEERNHAAKLTADDVRAIRAAYPATTQVLLAAKYGVTQRLISSILRHKIWRHLA